MPDEGRTADACVSWPDIFNGFGGPCTFFFYFSTSAWTSLHWIGLSVNIRKQNILVRTSESIRSLVLLNLRLLDLSRLTNAFNTR